ncbi:MAG: hypothetical protein JNK72_12815 [Myxococcales bacterium]|nr:hypothetical protein [Myxococcales bacterium]
MSSLPRSAWRLLLVAASATLSCNVFDASLYQTAGPVLADRCEMMASLPQVGSDTARVVMVDTRGLGDQYREFAACTGNDLPGNEGFFSVAMRRGETWHFHVDPIDPVEADPAVYVLPVCTTLQCSPSAASDVCGPGRGEHFSFRPEADGTFVVGIDSHLRGGARYGVTVVRPVCGNGVLEHGEPCDDARPQAGVTCERCHKVLARAMESEVGVANDDFTNAMALRPEAGGDEAFVVRGVLTVCDSDMFERVAAAGQRLEARVRPTEGAGCPEGLTLTVARSPAVEPPALTEVPTAETSAMAERVDGCPVVTVPSTQAGRYFVKVSAPQSVLSADFGYTLSTLLR